MKDQIVDIVDKATVRLAWLMGAIAAVAASSFVLGYLLGSRA